MKIRGKLINYYQKCSLNVKIRKKTNKLINKIKLDL